MALGFLGLASPEEVAEGLLVEVGESDSFPKCFPLLARTGTTVMASNFMRLASSATASADVAATTPSARLDKELLPPFGPDISSAAIPDGSFLNTKAVAAAIGASKQRSTKPWPDGRTALWPEAITVFWLDDKPVLWLSGGTAHAFEDVLRSALSMQVWHIGRTAVRLEGLAVARSQGSTAFCSRVAVLSGTVTVPDLTPVATICATWLEG